MGRIREGSREQGSLEVKYANHAGDTRQRPISAYYRITTEEVHSGISSGWPEENTACNTSLLPIEFLAKGIWISGSQRAPM